MPVVEQRSSIIDVIRHVSSSCHRLVSLKFSTEMIKLLLDEYGDLWRRNWKLAITLLSKECHLRDTCELSVDHLPHTSGWDDYFLIPHYPQNPSIDDEASESLNRTESDDVSDA
ncbi:hypothetical protein KIN20_019216 [Parelaphostrongylus tenuis]|uniref:Uncharacterized protein n=1 Tax=Parelaphostrongylus tenuis TaxID=148309 RepID=A0AAD5N4K7_PARTN|nr:hypothetical protein KIN20_019216 [Parelaphostrongylus tenuis]